MQLALAMSKEEHEEAVRKQKSDDIKLQMAIEQSKEEAKHVSRHFFFGLCFFSSEENWLINFIIFQNFKYLDHIKHYS